MDNALIINVSQSTKKMIFLITQVQKIPNFAYQIYQTLQIY